ncbi:MAG: YcxB family protein [Archangium sp.]|nr:YcxB family protein [Archangium sp.]
MSSEFTITAEDHVRFNEMAKAQLPPEGAISRSFGKTLWLWFALIFLFVGFYQHFSKPRNSAPAPETNYASDTILAAVGLGTGLLGGLFGYFMLLRLQRQVGGPLRASVSVDGIEYSVGTRTVVFPWSGVTRVMESEELFAMQFREEKTWTLFPLRAFPQGERENFVEALRQRKCSAPPPHVEPQRYQFEWTAELSLESARAWSSWWPDRMAGRLYAGSVALVTTTSIFLSIAVNAAFAVLALVGFSLLWSLLRQHLEAPSTKHPEPVTVMVGERLRVVRGGGGGSVAWDDVTGWGETKHLLIVRTRSTHFVVLREAVPGDVLEFVRARLAHAPRVDR